MSLERARGRGLTAAAVLVAALLGTSAAGAASADDRAAAQKHSSQAEELKKHGQLAEACKHLEEAERLDSKLPTLMDVAECTEQLGHVLEAQALWASARDRAKHDEKPQSRARAETRLAAVEKRVAHLTLQLAANAPPGAQVLRDDVPLEPASLASALPMNPGDHVIVVKLLGHDDAKYAVKLADGDNQNLAIAPGPATGSQAAASSPVPSPAVPVLVAPLPSTAVSQPTKQAAPVVTGWWSVPRTAGVILGSAGIVGIGAGSALYVVGNSDAKRRGSAVDQRMSLGGISLASGGVLFVTAIVLFASAPSDEAPQHARRIVTPSLFVARNGGVLGAAGEF
jgi:hypothetical protein